MLTDVDVKNFLAFIIFYAMLAILVHLSKCRPLLNVWSNNFIVMWVYLIIESGNVFLPFLFHDSFLLPSSSLALCCGYKMGWTHSTFLRSYRDSPVVDESPNNKQFHLLFSGNPVCMCADTCCCKWGLNIVLATRTWRQSLINQKSFIFNFALKSNY